MTPTGSVSVWIAGLQSGDAAAFESIWRRYAQQLAADVQRRLSARSAAYDGEDVAQSVFTAIWTAAESGRLQEVRSRDELWWFLTAIAQRKSIDRLRRDNAQKRGGGRVEGESSLNGRGVLFSIDRLIGEAPAPDFIAEMQEQYAVLMASLGEDLLVQIAHARLAGYDVAEIAQRVGVSHRTVERKLKIIRGRWASRLDDADEGTAAADERR
ncbi:RNA polymerase sigma factor [Botrimarina colliarenosi]|uniref:RNA polymerase sigma factor n=1 Tax=Botrimarina colliarenosi TaxID=2528001 RepID=A0A5C6A7I9_9BACT|nr:ECF-type sigma factor [Botrimarina colliarenosi]TWT95406.1 RNA polymerase sigma factor [Botrimarina colliarenosi]